MTWTEFHDLYMGKYFPDTARHAKAQEFLELKQGTMTVIEYVARFTELAHFADDYVATDMAKVRRFENGLKLSIWGRIVGLRLVGPKRHVQIYDPITKGLLFNPRQRRHKTCWTGS